MSISYVIVNGSLLPAEKATLNITDLSIQRGYGIFDFMKAVGGKPIFLEDHLDRFYSSAEQMRLTVKESRLELTDLIFTLIDKNGLSESGIRITLTGGYSPDGFNIAGPNMIITQQNFQINKDFDKSINIITHNYQRQFASAKTLDYLQAIWLQPTLAEKDADDVLYHNNGILCECPRANFFLVTENGEILTPANNILKGVTRKHILKVGKSLKAGERDLTLDDLKNAKEAFISSTTKNILAVTKIDGVVLGDGTPGKVTRELMSEFDKYVYR
jgi:branched-chain amino acid aminotransferase